MPPSSFPHLQRITLYPIKSLDGVEFDGARVLSCGALEHDRRWRLVDAHGAVVNAKRTSLLHRIRASFEVPAQGADWDRSVTLRIDPAVAVAARGDGPRPGTFPLVPGPSGPCDWLSEALGIAVIIEERPDGGFPDDRDAPGPTLVSTGSLAEVARWFGLALDDVRRRFRVNLEVDGCEPFWEDTLAHPTRPDALPTYGELGPSAIVDPWADLPALPPLAFRVGAAGFVAVNACRRCPVPGRDPATGSETVHFREVFEAWRRRRQRRDVDATDWNGSYRLAINTRGDGRGGNVRVGDRIVPVAHPFVS